jgi:hypothetical protein
MKTDAEKIKKLRAKNRELKDNLAYSEETSFRFFLQLKSANAEIVKLSKDNANLSIVMMEHLGCTEHELRKKITEILSGKEKKERSLINPFGS